MRTTVTIDDDVLLAAKAIAQQQNRFLGDVISDLARRALRRPKPKNSRNAGQVTDTFLLALAKTHGDQLATFDRKLSTAAVRSRKLALHLIQT